MIEHDELFEMYWGNGTPDGWLSLEEIAEQLDVDLHSLDDLFTFYRIEKRSRVQEAHKVVWRILVDGWGLSCPEGFLYETELNQIKLVFFIPDSEVGIKLNESQPANATDITHIHGAMIYQFSVIDLEQLTIGVVKALKENRVRKGKRADVKQTEKSEW